MERDQMVMVVGPAGPVEVESNEVFVREDGTLFIVAGGHNEDDEWHEWEVTVAYIDIFDTRGDA